ncbi:MAG TPA: hypothetical protein VKQ29_03645 [Aliidongia sp.]|nr:hypothetical protein [Aliidongia sp.]
MRNAWFDRPSAGRRFGMRRAALAAWAIVFMLFALVVIFPGVTSAHGPATPDRAIASLVARAAPPESDSCPCDEFDPLATTAAPSLC